MSREGARKGTGVVIARFQTPRLHDGHLELMKAACEHERSVVLLGVSASGPTKKNPLDFQTRYLMVRELFPNTIILPVHDMPSDGFWSDQVDSILGKVLPFGAPFMLYGGADSFIPHYCGKYPTHNLGGREGISGTDLRDQAASKPVNSEDFRKGAVYSIYNKYSGYSVTVDFALLNHTVSSGMRVLMGKKRGMKGLVFPGGFVGAGEDPAEAAVRELQEETGQINNGGARDAHLLGTFHGSADWRTIRDDVHILTLFYVGHYLSGPIEGKDDLSKVEWVDVYHPSFVRRVNLNHRPLAEKLLKHVKGIEPWKARKD